MDINASVVFQQTPLPAGIAYGSTLADLVDSASVTVQSLAIFPSVGSVTFPSVAPGDYTVNVQSFDSNGAKLGNVATAAIIVPVPVPGTFPEPASVTLSLH